MIPGLLARRPAEICTAYSTEATSCTFIPPEEALSSLQSISKLSNEGLGGPVLKTQPGCGFLRSSVKERTWARCMSASKSVIKPSWTRLSWSNLSQSVCGGARDNQTRYVRIVKDNKTVFWWVNCIWVAHRRRYLQTGRAGVKCH